MAVIEKNFSYDVDNGLCLNLENLMAQVNVKVGTAGVVKVNLKGEKEYLDLIELKPSRSNVAIRTKDQDFIKLNIVNKSKGEAVSLVMSSFSDRSIQVRSISDSAVIVNGQKFDPGYVKNIETKELPIVNIEVPPVTNLEVHDVYNLTSDGLGAKLRLMIGGDCEANIAGATDTRIQCSGASDFTGRDIHNGVRSLIIRFLCVII